MMIELVKRSLGYALAVPLILGPAVTGASAQEGEDAGEDIQNVLLTFHLIEADGYTGQDPAISDIVAELRKLLNFKGYRLLSESVFNVGLTRQPVGRALQLPLSGNGIQTIVQSDSSEIQIRVAMGAARSAETARATVTLREITSPNRTLRTLLEVTVNMRDGQRVVLGSALRSPGKPVLILTVTARIDPDLSGGRAPLSCEDGDDLRDRVLEMTRNEELANTVLQQSIEKQCQDR